MRFGSVEPVSGGRYRARFTHPHKPVRLNGAGKPVRNRIKAPHTFERKNDAWAWLAQQKADIDRGVWESPEDQHAREEAEAKQAALDAYSFGEHAERYFERPLKPSTLKASLSYYRKHLEPRWGNVPLKQITTQEITTWIGKELAPGKDGARKKAFELFRAILADAVDDERISRNPCTRRHSSTVSKIRTTQRHKPRALTPEQVWRLADEVADSTRCLVVLLAFTGLRIGEARELRRKDIDLSHGVIHVTRGVTGDGKTLAVGTPKSDAGIRDVPVNGIVLDTLAEHLRTQVMRGKESLLFPSPEDPSKHRSETGIYKNIRRAAERAGIGRVSPHDMRHTFASHAGRVPDMGQIDVQRALGQSSPGMAARYSHTTEAHQKRLADGVGEQLSRGREIAAIRSLDDERKKREA